MKIIGILFVAACITTGCRQNCKEKIAGIFKESRKAFENEREVNKFILNLSYMPTSVLAYDEPKDGKPIQQRDTAYYYFKLKVVCPEDTHAGSGNTLALYYGLDSLFATGETPPFANPVSVEPVITGNRKAFLYLLIFDKKDITDDKQVHVVFYDRLFTNTKQVFVFDRKKIDEIETFQCK